MAGPRSGGITQPVERAPAATRGAGISLATLWNALPPAGRIALVGVVASALVAVALGVFITREIRHELLEAEGRGLQAAVAAVEPSLAELVDGPLSADEIALLDRLVDRWILDGDRVRTKLWALDGVVVYSDVRDLIGRHFADVRPRLALAVERGIASAVTDLADLENEFERQYRQLVEFYVPVRDPDGRAVAVLEIYQDVGSLEEALGAINGATWGAIGSGLGILLIFLVALVATTVRSIGRDRAAAESRAGELAVLVGAAEALASSLEPHEFLGRLDESVRRGLGLSRLAIEPSPAPTSTALRLPLRDGSWLVAERASSAPTVDDERVLRSVANSLDAALANAALYAEVRDAAQQRRQLLRQVVEAHEDERRHIVGELHDSLAGELIRVLYGIRGIGARSAHLPREMVRELEALERLVAEAEQHLRAFMSRMRPAAIDEFGLAAALEETVSRYRQESRLEVRLRVRGDVASISPEVQLVMLRAAEEALLNVRKHADAKRVLVSVRADATHVVLSVEDDGVGWGLEAAEGEGRGLGLAYLHERVVGFGGDVQRLRSRLGGARLVVRIPRGAA